MGDSCCCSAAVRWVNVEEDSEIRPDSNAVVQRMVLPLLVLVLLVLRFLALGPATAPTEVLLGPDSIEEAPEAKRLGEGGNGKLTKSKSTED